ncbi:hypothetical protein L905_13740 [Agrobacterium sp. TS43]|nr:hypothetical protein L903_18325 [Agrobacterium sp. JL28]KVK50628.1 hypothetical protein L904_18330 [Agrobacterium sp. LY4]KVK59166.1 hypothetical protein L906_25120 [Agrobacterium sp. TS45]KVK62630.1 hypothetical protein L907_25950 [Agrobacterium sp. C13]KVK69420.1 hypothetical protein L905_13740 [Agrobacterium sp. TS43]
MSFSGSARSKEKGAETGALSGEIYDMTAA